MNKLLRVAVADVAIVALFAAMAWGAWAVTGSRGLPSWLRVAVFAAVLMLGVGGYAKSALPWWLKKLSPNRSLS